MKILFKLLFILIFLYCSVQSGISQDFDDDEPVRIVFVLDGDNTVFSDLEGVIKQEVTALLSSKFKYLEFNDDKRVSGGFSDAMINQSLDDLYDDPEVDLIIGIGSITSVNLASRGDLPKPSIAIGIINPVFQEIPFTAKQTSGVDNFTYVTLPFSPRRDYEVFRSIVNFKNLGIILSDRFLSSLPKKKTASHYFNKATEGLGFEYRIIPVSADSPSFESEILDDLDGVYTGLYFDFSNKQIESLYQAINNKGIPSFAMGGEAYVEMGAMATVSSEDVQNRISRRTALNIEKILDGKNPKNIPVLLGYTQSLMLNQRTMNQIGFYPSFDVLSEAKVLYEDEFANMEILFLLEVIQEALDENLDLRVATLDLESSSKEIGMARSYLLPQMDVSATGLLIDKDRASSSMGQNPEQSIYGTAMLSQLIFSERAFANVSIQKRIFESLEFGYQSTEMDIILDAATLFINILQTVSMETIARENLRATRKNLEIARMRQSTGYSGISDVYRWESKISTDKIDLLTTNENRRLAEYALLEMLNRPFDQKFLTEAVDIKDTNIFVMGDASISKYIGNAFMKDMFRDFLVMEALTNLPELKELDATIAAHERYMKSVKRTHYLPQIGVFAQADYDFYRGGEGSTLEPIEFKLDPSQPPVTINMFEEPKDFSWNIGLNASLPISQGGYMHYDRQQSILDLSILKEQRYNISRKLTQQVISLFETASLSYPKIALSANAAENALKSFNIVQDSYSQGVVSITDLIDAQQAAVEANLYSAISVYEYLIDVLMLQRAIGRYFILLPYEERADFFYRLEQYISSQPNTK